MKAFLGTLSLAWPKRFLVAVRNASSDRISYCRELVEDVLLWFVTLPVVSLRDQTIEVNSFFNSADLQKSRQKIRDMRHLDRHFRRHLDEQGIKGLRLWEYSVLLCSLQTFKGRKILDVGSGRSLLCLFLKRQGADVITFDLPVSFQWIDPVVWKKKKRHGVKHVSGNMLRLPFADESFDLVLSISAIEHLQQITKGVAAKPYNTFLEDTGNGLREMARVVKKRGYVYITSEIYDPQLQKGDRWWNQGDEVACAYRCGDLDHVFIETLQEASFAFDREYNYDFNLVRSNEKRCNYRGRYITTFALLMTKLDH